MSPMATTSTREKHGEDVVRVDVLQSNDRSIDDALIFLQRHEDETATIPDSDSALRQLRRKIDVHVISFLMMCYTLNFLDKVLLNYSQVMGIAKDLRLRGNDFSNAASAFYIAVLVAIVPNVYLLQRLPLAKWLGTCLICWGICTSCHAAIRDYHGLLAVRIISGAFESAVPPVAMLLSSQYYTRREQAVRFALWYCGLGIGQVLGGLISFAFQHITSGAPLAGWRIMFLVIGLVTFVSGTSVIFAVPDTPMKAWFLSDREKITLLHHVKKNQTGIENAHFQPRQLFEALTDAQMWLACVIIALQLVGGGVITTYSAQLIKNFGFSPKNAALLNMPSGVVNCISTLVCGLGSRFFGHRWAWVASLTLVSVIGACLLAFLPTSNKAGLLVSIYLVNAIPGTTPVVFQWLMCNTAGHTKRAFGSAALSAAFAIGNIIGPQTFRARQAPHYESAKVALVCTWCAAVGVTLALACLYALQNKRRGGTSSQDGDDVSANQGFAGLTDRQNPDFRYQY